MSEKPETLKERLEGMLIYFDGRRIAGRPLTTTEKIRIMTKEFEGLVAQLKQRIAWLKDKADGDTPPCADLRVYEVERVLALLNRQPK